MKWKPFILLALVVCNNLSSETRPPNNPAPTVAPQNEYEQLISILTKYGNNPKRWSALNYAIDAEDYQAALILVDYTENINQIDDKFNALNRLFRKSNGSALKPLQIELAKKLIHHGIDLSPESNLSYAPLTFSIRGRSIELVYEILDRGVDVNELHGLPIREAARFGNLEILRVLINRGADVNISVPIYTAISEENYEAIEILLGAGAKLSYENHLPVITPCILSQNIDMLTYLLSIGANPNEKMASNAWKATSLLELALSMEETSTPAKQRKNAIIELLLVHGARL